MSIEIEFLGGLCPVQADGTIDGVPFYFRARGDAWHVEIGEGNTHLVVASMAIDGRYADNDESRRLRALPTWEYGESYKEWPEAGYMPEDEARAFIARAADLWRASREPS